MSDWLEVMLDLAKIVKPTSGGKRHLRFKGQEYVLIGTREYGGAIATQEQYEKGECSFAHLFMPQGVIMRFHEQIGTVGDIEWL